jgi:hypothetical protein
MLLLGNAGPLLINKLALGWLLHLVHLLLRLLGLMLLLWHNVRLSLMSWHLGLGWLLTLVYLGLSRNYLLRFKISLLLHSLPLVLLSHDHVLLEFAVLFDFVPAFG